jgi:hypothetical protein
LQRPSPPPSTTFVDAWQRHLDIQHSLANPISESAAAVSDPITRFFKFRADCERE